MSLSLPRLYAILDVDAVVARGLAPLAVLDAWLDAGVRLVQLRAKTLTFGPFLALADDVGRRVAAAGGRFVVNDRADVAALARAWGLHLGQTDLTPAEARPMLDSGVILGVSTHSAAQAAAALQGPVDYVAIGPVFRTASKARPDPVVGLEGVQEAAELARQSARPVVAIGGITIDTAPDVLAAGACSVAVIGDLLVGDPATRAREWIEAVGA